MAKRPLTHAQAERLLSVYADLEASEKQAVEHHLAHCAQCQQRLRQYREVDAVLQNLPAPLQSARLQQGFQQALSERRQQKRRRFFGSLNELSWTTATAVFLLSLVVVSFWFIIRTTALNPSASGVVNTATPSQESVLATETATSQPATPTPLATPLPTAISYTLEKSAELFQYETPITSTAFSADGQWIAVGNQAGVITVWELANGRRTHNFVATETPIVDLATDGEKLAFVSEAGFLQVRDLAAGTALWEATIEVAGGVSLSLASDGLVAILQQGVVLRDAIETQTLPYTADVVDVAFGQNGRFLYTINQMGELQQWDVATAYRQQTWSVTGLPILTLATTPNSEQVGLLGADGVAQTWSMETQAAVKEWLLPAELIAEKAVALAIVDGRVQIAVGTSRGAVEIWGAP